MRFSQQDESIYSEAACFGILYVDYLKCDMWDVQYPPMTHLLKMHFVSQKVWNQSPGLGLSECSLYLLHVSGHLLHAPPIVQ